MTEIYLSWGHSLGAILSLGITFDDNGFLFLLHSASWGIWLDASDLSVKSLLLPEGRCQNVH